MAIYSNAEEAGAETLAKELQVFSPLTSGWHYLLMDGVQCASPTAKKLPWGSGIQDESCLVSQSVWEDAAREGTLKSFECRLSPSPGWCLGAYHRGKPNPDMFMVGEEHASVERSWIGDNDAVLNGERNLSSPQLCSRN